MNWTLSDALNDSAADKVLQAPVEQHVLLADAVHVFSHAPVVVVTPLVVATVFLNKII